MIVELLQCFHVLFYHHVALFVPVALHTPRVRGVLAQHIIHVLVMELLYTGGWWHFQLLLESLESERNHDFEELVANNLPLRVDHQVCPEREMLVAGRIGCDEGQIDI